ncbi:MAG: YesL family protein [Lachnospiraceae bacterium]|nr:YesL family protein [Lachnospiraceae bacterium]
MKRLLDLDNPVFKFIIKIFDCIVLSVIWTVFSLPVFTMGASSTAMYAVVYHYIRHEEGYLWKTFIKTFKENFKRSTLSWLPLLATLLFLLYDVLALRTLIQAGNPLGRLYGVIVAFLFVALVWAVYMAAYTARFQGTVKDMIRYSFYLLMAHPLRSLGVMVVVVGCIIMIWVVPGLAAILPAVSFWIASPMVEQVFRLHLSPEDLKEEEEKESDRL